MGVSFMMILNFAVDAFTAFVKRVYWAAPSIVVFGLWIASRHAGDTGCASDGVTIANVLRTRCGAVGARSGLPVSGLLHTPVALAFGDRNERSSRKNTSAFLPHRKVR